VPSSLLEFSVHAVTEGIDALGEVSVRVRADATSGKRHPQHDAAQRVFHGHGADTDILVASAKAYLAALNRLLGTYGVEGRDDAASENNQSGARGAAVETAG
jgi:2-isopropylmalate synthase